MASDDELEAPEEAPQPLEQEPPSPDYMPGPEHPPSPDYVLDLENLKYLVPTDDEVPIEDQPLPADASPIALSLGYKMAQKRTAATTTISMADAQLKALIAWGVADALAERDADRSR
ncbi:hypothetical protein Tco_0709366 [Tanacetum coccineum]